MKIRHIHRSALVVFIVTVSHSAFSWNHSVEIGAGKSHDPNDTKHYNSGVMLSADVLPLWRTHMTLGTLNGALGRWYSTAPQNKNLITAAVSVAARIYPFDLESACDPYILGSWGPTYLSTRELGNNEQGTNLTFQWIGGLGVEYQHIDVNFKYVHYSSAQLFSPNEGFNIQYMLSVGYLF